MEKWSQASSSWDSQLQTLLSLVFFGWNRSCWRPRKLLIFVCWTGELSFKMWSSELLPTHHTENFTPNNVTCRRKTDRCISWSSKGHMAMSGSLESSQYLFANKDYEIFQSLKSNKNPTNIQQTSRISDLNAPKSCGSCYLRHWRRWVASRKPLKPTNERCLDLSQSVGFWMILVSFQILNSGIGNTIWRYLKHFFLNCSLFFERHWTN